MVDVSSPALFWLELLLASLVPSVVNRVAFLVNGRVAAYCPWLTDVVSLLSDSLEMDSSSIVELLRAVEGGIRRSTANPETSGTPSFMPEVPSND